MLNFHGNPMKFPWKDQIWWSWDPNSPGFLDRTSRDFPVRSLECIGLLDWGPYHHESWPMTLADLELCIEYQEALMLIILDMKGTNRKIPNKWLNNTTCFHIFGDFLNVPNLVQSSPRIIFSKIVPYPPFQRHLTPGRSNWWWVTFLFQPILAFFFCRGFRLSW